MQETKRLFFGLEVSSPWPPAFPSGRILEEPCRHLTMAFLGNANFHKIMDALPTTPLPPRQIGFAGVFDHCLFLPERHPHVAAWHVQWLQDGHLLEAYQQQLTLWIKSHGFPVDGENCFLPHVTLCREPFVISEWKQAFIRLPLFTSHFHLYESLGSSRYRSCWHLPFRPPFEEIDHTADIAFIVRGENLSQIYFHACQALAFKFPPLLDYFGPQGLISDLDDIVIELNDVIARADVERGCPFKAISFHGSLQEEGSNLKWEMIVDV